MLGGLGEPMREGLITADEGLRMEGHLGGQLLYLLPFAPRRLHSSVLSRRPLLFTSSSLSLRHSFCRDVLHARNCARLFDADGDEDDFLGPAFPSFFQSTINGILILFTYLFRLFFFEHKMESRIFISAGTSHKILRKPNYAKCFNNEKRYEGEIQKLNNILRLHGHKVLREKSERENVFQALSIISSKINKGAEWSPLYTAKAIDAAYLHRTLFRYFRRLDAFVTVNSYSFIIPIF
jgi:hypothetical protein